MISKLLAYLEQKRIDKATVKPDEVLEFINSADIPCELRSGLGEIGIKEHPGQNHNPRIVEYHQTCDLRAKADEISWCSAFVNWCFAQCQNDSRTKSAAAISWAKWGKETKDPRIGDIVVFKRIDSTWQGHVGFFIGHNDHSILVFGGNQGNSVSFQWYKKQGKNLRFFQYRTSR